MRFPDLCRRLLLAGALLAAGCDVSISMQGKAYRWIDPPAGAASRVTVDDPGAVLPAQVEPLADVEVTLYHDAEDSHRRTKLWREDARSAADGSFEDGGAGGSGSYDMVVGAKRLGCDAAVQAFRHEQRHPDHEVTVLLICPHGVPKIPPRRHSPVLGN